MFKIVYVSLVPVEREHVAVGAAYLLECLPTIASLWFNRERALVIGAQDPLCRPGAQLPLRLSVFLRGLVGLFALFLLRNISLRCLHVYNGKCRTLGRGRDDKEPGCAGQEDLLFWVSVDMPLWVSE